MNSNIKSSRENKDSFPYSHLIYLSLRRKTIRTLPNAYSQANNTDIEQTETPQNSADVSSSTQTEKGIVENSHYFYAQGTNPVGPLSLEELIHSNIDAETLVWKTGMKDWEPAKCFPELQSLIDITTGPDEQENSQEIQVKPNEDQILNDRTEDNEETSEKNIDESFMEELSYYYAEGTTPVGPLSLKALVQTNLNSDTLIWKVGMKNWKPARCFPEIQPYIRLLNNSIQQDIL